MLRCFSRSREDNQESNDVIFVFVDSSNNDTSINELIHIFEIQEQKEDRE